MRNFKEDMSRWSKVCTGKSPEHAKEVFGELYALLWALQVTVQYINSDERNRSNKQADIDHYLMYYTLDFTQLYTDITDGSFEDLYEKLPEKILLKRYGVEKVNK